MPETTRFIEPGVGGDAYRRIQRLIDQCVTKLLESRCTGFRASIRPSHDIRRRGARPRYVGGLRGYRQRAKTCRTHEKRLAKQAYQRFHDHRPRRAISSR